MGYGDLWKEVNVCFFFFFYIISILSFFLNFVLNIWLQWNVWYELVFDDGYILYSILLLYNVGNG